MANPNSLEAKSSPEIKDKKFETVLAYLCKLKWKPAKFVKVCNNARFFLYPNQPMRTNAMSHVDGTLTRAFLFTYPPKVENTK